MKILLNVSPPPGDGFESRLPNHEELGPFMARLMRIVNGVDEKVAFRGGELWCKVWFINREGHTVGANLHVDIIGHRTRSAVHRSLGINDSNISIADAEGGVSPHDTDEDVDGQISCIVQQLEKSFESNK